MNMLAAIEPTRRLINVATIERAIRIQLGLQ